MELSSTSTQQRMQTPREPLITWKSFLISFLIILGVFTLISMLVGESTPQRHTAKTRAPIDDQYEYKVVDGNPDAAESILVVPVHGIILTDPTSDSGFFDFLTDEGVTYGYDVKQQLVRAAKDPSIRAVLLDINSPGGTIPGSVAVADGIRQYKELSGNPVYAHITDLGASGGYWAAAAADRITADPGSTTGSIGVIFGPLRFYDRVVSESDFFSSVQTENGISYRFFTAGQFKDSGSPYRRLTEEEERHWQTSVNNEYERFVQHVSKSRKIPRETIIGTIKALAYENARAIQLGLIDAEASRGDAIEELAKAAGLVDYSVIRESERFNFFKDLFGMTHALAAGKGERTTGACSWCNAPLYLYDRTYRLGTQPN